VLPPALAARSPHTTFGMFGTCGDYTRVAGYQPLGVLEEGDDPSVAGMSCLFGWTCGNLIAPGSEVAAFFWELFGPNPTIVSEDSARTMLGRAQGVGFTLPTPPFPAWVDYGLGVMSPTYNPPTPWGRCDGHLGQ